MAGARDGLVSVSKCAFVFAPNWAWAVQIRVCLCLCVCPPHSLYRIPNVFGEEADAGEHARLERNSESERVFTVHIHRLFWPVLSTFLTFARAPFAPPVHVMVMVAAV